MLQRTHLLITLFFILLLLPHVYSKLIFVCVALFATLIPDLDTRYSRFGRKKFARVLQFFTKHRGIIHSFSFLFLLTVFFVLFTPVVSLGFFLGYGLHLVADSFTLEGIQPFPPFKKRASGKIRTGGQTEIIVLFVFIFANVLLFAVRVKSIF